MYCNHIAQTLVVLVYNNGFGMCIVTFRDKLGELN